MTRRWRASRDGSARTPDAAPGPGEYGSPEAVDLDSHPRLVVIGVLLVLVLLVGGVVAFASSIGAGDRAVVSQVVVPRSAGRAAAEAQKQLERLGLLTEISFESNELIPPGTVVSQNPIAGSRLEIGQLVTLVVSDGPAGMEVPDVRGLHGAEASSLLQTVGLQSKVEQVYDDAVRVGEAVGSSPTAGSRSAVGTTVTVKISKGPAPRTVPQVVDVPDSQAMAAIARAKLKIGRITHRTGTGRPVGTVISATPGPGTQVPRNMPVNLVVAEDPAAPIVPDLVGLGRSAAEQVLRGIGLRATSQGEAVPMGDSRDGLVIAQTPIAGTPLQDGAQVTLIVAVAPEPPTTVPSVSPQGPPPTGPPGGQGGG